MMSPLLRLSLGVLFTFFVLVPCARVVAAGGLTNDAAHLGEDSRDPLLIAFVAPPVKSRFNAFLAFASEAARRNHTIEFWTFEGCRNWVTLDLIERPNFSFRSLPETATANNFTLYKWQLEEFQRLQNVGGVRNLWEAQKLKKAGIFDGLKDINGNFTHHACGDGGKADVAVIDLLSAGALRACQSANVLVAVPSAQVITNVASVAPHVLEPTVVSSIVFSSLSEDILREASLAGTFARLLNAAATSLIEGLMYPAFTGFLRHGIFFAMTVPEIEGAREVGPLVRYVGPFVDEARQLPDDDLDEWLNSHGDGVVLVSMGTILASEHHIGAVAAAVLRMASEDAAGVGVLWAVQQHQRSYIPDHLAAALESHPRVRVQGHLPQLLVLRHPNVRLFVTHGGHNSVHEGLFYGKPLVVVPGAVDQGYNAKRAERAGAAKVAEPNPESIMGAAIAVLGDPSFRKRASILSKSLVKAGGAAAAVDVVEVMAYDHGGDVSAFVPNRLAAHWALQWLLDVRFASGIILYLVFCLTRFCCRGLLRCCCCRSRRAGHASASADGSAKDKAA